MSSRDEWLLVEPLFDQALDLAPAQRAEFVCEVRQRSRRLAGKLIQLLEAADGAEDVIIDRSLEDVAPALIEKMPVDRTTGLEMGSYVGKYRLLELLGSGGMGQVFKAQGPVAEEGPGAEGIVAVKVLLAQNRRTNLEERFVREQRILASLDHPSIAAVFDSGTSQQGFLYFALRLVEGPCIMDFCQQEELNLRQKVELLRAVCEPVQAAHTLGVVHRDLKPSNILVEGTLNDHRPIVLDFGIARDSLPMEITGSGQIIGTPGYMAPEQARGDSRRVDQRSDVFSLGVLAYEAIAGHNPFDMGNPVETMAAIIRAPAPALCELRSEVDVHLSDVVHRCLEKEPALRPSSVEDLAIALDGWLE